MWFEAKPDSEISNEKANTQEANEEESRVNGVVR